MPNFEVKKVTCPHCLKQQNVNVYPAVNVLTDPDMKNKVLSADVFLRKCKHCSNVFELKHPLLYCDIENNFMVYYIPDIESGKIIDKSLEAQFPDLRNMRRRIVPNMEDLKEKILIFESGLDDMAIETAKLAVHDAMKPKLDSEIKKITFSFCNRDKNTMGFVFETDSGPYHQSTRLEIYDKASFVVKKTLNTGDFDGGFLKIDKQWADNILFRFKTKQHRKKMIITEQQGDNSSAENTNRGETDNSINPENTKTTDE